MSDEAKLICKFFGHVEVIENGKPVKYIWNYETNEPERIEDAIIKNQFNN